MDKTGGFYPLDPGSSPGGDTRCTKAQHGCVEPCVLLVPTGFERRSRYTRRLKGVLVGESGQEPLMSVAN